MPISESDFNAAFKMPPTKAIEFFESKNLVISEKWTDVWAEAHAKSFTVAGIANLDILQDVQDSLTTAMKKGESFNSWRNNLESTLKSKGWIHKNNLLDKATGQVLVKNKRMASRLSTIYRTNLQSAYAAGRYQEQMANILMRPYGRYTSVLDGRQRPSHGAMDGVTFRLDDPFWGTFYPPCGFGCRCYVRTLSERDVAKNKLDVYETKDGDFETVMQSVNKNTSRPNTLFKHPSGRSFMTDPGFNHNPGKIRYLPNLDKYSPVLAAKFIDGSLRGRDFIYNYERFEKSVLNDLDKFKTLSNEEKIKALINKRVNESQGFKWPVALLDEDLSKLLNSTHRTVLLSDDTLIKQIMNRTGQNVLLQDYYQLNQLLKNAEFYKLDGDKLALFSKKTEEVYFEAIIKLTKQKDELYLVSFFKTNYSRLLKNLSIGKIFRR